MKKVGLVMILSMLIVFSACEYVDRERINGNGKQVTQNYDFKQFADVDISGAVNVILQQGPGYEVKLETDENLVNYLEVAVRDGDELYVKTKKGVNLQPSSGIDLYITAPYLNKISASGASSLKTTGKYTQDQKIEFELHGASEGELAVRAPRVEMEATGASTCTIEGENRDIKADAQGASTINAFNLKTENAEADASGASTIRIFSSVNLQAEASGASTIKYKGNPTTNIQSSGASSVGKEN